MKVRQFLKKMLYASSTIKHVYVVRGEQKTELTGTIAVYDPMATDSGYEDQLNARLVSFRIVGDELVIYGGTQ